jgi:hypothetical protein
MIVLQRKERRERIRMRIEPPRIHVWCQRKSKENGAQKEIEQEGGIRQAEGGKEGHGDPHSKRTLGNGWKVTHG